MPKPEIRRMNISADQNGRLRPMARRRFVGGWSVGARRGATDGPVGDVRNRLPSSRRSSTDKVILFAIRLEIRAATTAVRALPYTALLLGNMPGTPNGVANGVNARRRCAWAQPVWRRVLRHRFVPALSPIRRRGSPH